MMDRNNKGTNQKITTTMVGTPKWKVNVILILCFFECLLFGGTIFGWTVLAFVFKIDDVYRNACNETQHNPNNVNVTLNFTQHGTYAYQKDNNLSAVYQNGYTEQKDDTISTIYQNGSRPYVGDDVKFAGCAAQDSHFSLAYTLAIVIMGVMAFPVGWIFDRFGLMVTRTAATCLCLPALVMLATCRDDLSWMLYLALPMLATTNIIMIVTNNHVCTLAGDKTSTMIALYSGTVSASGVVFIFIKLAFDAGIPRLISLLVLAACWMLVGVTTFIFLPRFKIIPNPRNDDSHQKNGSVSSDKPYTLAPAMAPENDEKNGCKLNGVSEDEGFSGKAKKRSSFRVILGSPYLFLHVLWFSVLHLRLHFFAGSFVPWATRLLNDKTEQVALACDVFGYTQATCVLVSPIVGLLLDRKRRYLNARQVAGRRRAVAAVTSLTLATVVSALLGVSTLVSAPWVVFVTPELSHIYRSFLYATALAYIDFTFPKKHSGKLIGLMYFAGGAASFFQHVIFLWAEESGFTQPNIALLVLCLLTMVHPLVIYLKDRAARSKSPTPIQLKNLTH